MTLLKAEDLRRDYRMGTESVHALDGISFEVEAGTFVSVMGPSGSGKSTLLHLVGGLDRPTGGKVLLDGRDLAALDDESLTTLRRRELGFIFQFFNLLPTLSAWENVALPLLLDGKKLSDTKPRAVGLLERVGLGQRVDHRPSQLSGGEMQRVAIARALVADPVLLLADEPTGNLDSRSGEQVLELLRSTVTEDGKTLVMVTHDHDAASTGDRILTLIDGKLVQDDPSRAKLSETESRM
ncbi:MAG: ABC transporter ATP-binding protein [Actinobacteria bacterium]|nr:ABC transporter ATP-binding protein [Actinomycetota bacterium]